MTNKNVVKVLEMLIEKTNNLEATTDMLEEDNIKIQEKLRQSENYIKKSCCEVFNTLLLVYILFLIVHWILQLF